MYRIESTFSREVRKSWRTLASAFVCLLFAFSGPAFSLPFLYGPILEEFGWSREEVTLLASAKYAAGAVAAVVGGFGSVTGAMVGGIVVALLETFWSAYLTLAYTPMSDDDLRTYTDLSATGPGRDLNRALFAGFYEVFQSISFELGRAASSFMVGEEL